MLSGTPGAGRYAHSEREQRWLLRALPEDCRDPVEILDHYLTGTRLRLRRMQSGNQVIWKLGQKVRERDTSPEVVKLTNIYLSEQEHSVVAGLDASTLSKTRWQWDVGGFTFAVDAFLGELAGLVIAEVELDLGTERIEAPPNARAEVTDVDRYSGGALAALDRQAAMALVQAVGSGVEDRSPR